MRTSYLIMVFFALILAINVNDASAKTISKNATQKHTLVNSDLQVCTITVHKSLTQDYTCVSASKRKYTTRTVSLWYTYSGAFSPYKATCTNVGYADSSNKIVKKFDWKNYSILIPTDSKKIFSKQNSANVTYEVTNSYKLYASYWVQCYDVAGAERGMGNVSLLLKNAI